MSIIEKMQQCVVDGAEDDIQEIVQQAIDSGLSPKEIINDGLIGGMNIVTPLFKKGEMFVPEVMGSAETMNTGMQLVKPLLVEGDVKNKGKVIIGTVNGDLHDIGKNLVVLMLESSGYEVVDLGIDVKEDEFSAAIKEHQPDIVALSCLLTTTMIKIQDTLDQMKNDDLLNQVKVIIGGAPVSIDYANEVGADGYSDDAAGAVDLCNNLMGI